jgi:hypothetical protein
MILNLIHNNPCVFMCITAWTLQRSEQKAWVRLPCHDMPLDVSGMPQGQERKHPQNAFMQSKADQCCCSTDKRSKRCSSMQNNRTASTCNRSYCPRTHTLPDTPMSDRPRHYTDEVLDAATQVHKKEMGKHCTPTQFLPWQSNMESCGQLQMRDDFCSDGRIDSRGRASTWVAVAPGPRQPSAQCLE